MTCKPKLLAAAILLAIGGTASAEVVEHPAVGRALGLIQAHAAAIHAGGNDRFLARDVIVDGDGTEHVRFNRTYAGLPVIGGDVVVHSRNGLFVSTSLTQRGELSLDVHPVLQRQDAIFAAGIRFGSQFRGTPAAELVIYARGATPVLAYRVGLVSDDADMTYIVDARNGRLLDSWSNLETAAAIGTGKTLYSGNIALTTKVVTGGFQLLDPSRGGSYTINASGRSAGQVFTDADNSWGNNSNSDPATAAADAQFGVATTWDYYKNVHGRNGIANTGQGSYNRVHYGRKYSNAFWSDSCFCMTYGDGDGVVVGPLVSLDITGHEMSHGVMARTANLTYSGESGGLNEANSDIMGTMVEFYANNASDTGDYLLGEESFIANIPGSANQTALRFMWSPNKDGASADCWYPGLGSLDVHYSSGPANHFYYLLAEGSGSKTFSGVTHAPTTCKAGDTKKGTGNVSLAGIGRAKAEKIWYRAVAVYMTSSTDYAGARAATISAAKDLYGALSTEANAVAASWGAVGVN